MPGKALADELSQVNLSHHRATNEKPMSASAKSRNPALKPFRYYDWSAEDWSVIEANLKRHRDNLAQLLDIDVEAEEGCPEPPPLPEGEAQSVAAYVAWRRSPGSDRLVATIDIAIDELAIILTRFVADLNNVNNLASEAQAFRTLEQLSKIKAISEDEIMLLDPQVRALLAKHYPGGRVRFSPQKIRCADVRTAAKAALKVIPKPTRGRPPGTSNRAAQTLTGDLARFFENNGPARPARSHIVNKTLDPNRPDAREAGRFREFVNLAVNCLPEDARARLTRTGGSIDWLVRTAVAGSDTYGTPC